VTVACTQGEDLAEHATVDSPRRVTASIPLADTIGVAGPLIFRSARRSWKMTKSSNLALS
jgi:hypothetical protein